jgi:hypothetical protein
MEDPQLSSQFIEKTYGFCGALTQVSAGKQPIQQLAFRLDLIKHQQSPSDYCVQQSTPALANGGPVSYEHVVSQRMTACVLKKLQEHDILLCCCMSCCFCCLPSGWR